MFRTISWFNDIEDWINRTFRMFQKAGKCILDWINDKVNLWTFMNALMQFWIPYKAGNFYQLRDWEIVKKYFTAVNNNINSNSKQIISY